MGIDNIVIFGIKGLYIFNGLFYNKTDNVKKWNEDLYDRRSGNCGDAGE